jgi:hypothetical protein
MKLYRCLSTLFWIVLLTAGLSACGQAASPPADAAKEPSMAAIAKECQGCHRGPMSLDKLPAAELTGIVTEIVAGELTHPTELPELSEQQIAELVRALKPE